MKTAVIGAGPAGLFAAIFLAKKNIAVDLYDKGRAGEGITCGECIFDYFGVLPKPDIGMLYEVEQFIVRTDKTYIKNVRRYDRLWMMDRSAWQRWLAAVAVRSGVRMFENTPVSVSDLKELSRRNDYIIDCSGAPSLTGQAYGFTGEYLKIFNAACQYEMEGDFTRFAKSLYIGLLPDIPSENLPGYYWIFPKSNCRANVGIGYRKNAKGGTLDLWKKLDEVIAAEELSDASIVRKGGGFLPVARPSSLLHGNILLAGDAAGLTSAFSGEGIDLACISGVMAAQSIAERHTGHYQREIEKLMHPKYQLDKAVCRFFQNSSYARIDELVDVFFNKKLSLNKDVVSLAYAVAKLLWSWKINSSAYAGLKKLIAEGL